VWIAAGRLLGALAFGGSIAAIAIVVGTRDLESYEHAVFSLNRGTAVRVVSVIGQPVHTLAFGFGVRLPLHGSLGASPAATLAPYLPLPLTYWLLLAFTIAAALLIVRRALEPTCGQPVSWMAAVLLFCSVPMVNYTIYDDWPDTAVTYCASVACVFAPHAMLNSLYAAATRAGRRIGALSVAATVWALLVLAHPGHWPQLASALVLTGALALCRSDHSFRTRLAVVGALALVSLTAVALPGLDILRDLNATTAGGDTDRAIDPFSASVLSSNIFPFGEVGARFPFSYLLLAVVSILVGIASPHAHVRVVILGSAFASIALVFGATTLSTRESVSAYEPSAIWTLRDPAGVFAVLSGAWATAATYRSPPHRRRVALKWGAAGALAIAALQGPAYAVRLVAREGVHEESWTRDLTALEGRAWRRGLAPDRVPPGKRLVLWPDVRQAMRSARQPSTDFADAGYFLVTAWTKQRTMRGFIENNSVLFNQTTELSARVLCDAQAAQFLQLRYLLRPADVTSCAPWSRVPDLRVDDRFEVDVARQVDDRIRALPVGRLAEPSSRKPALAADSELLPALTPLAGTSLTIAPPGVVLRFDDPSVARGQALVLPVAYDAAWRPSSGQVRNVGGLLAVVGVDQRQLTLTFVPDLVAVLRALAMTLAQVLALAGALGLAYRGRANQPRGAPPVPGRLP
jgi:hypothetical protein